MQTFRIHFFKEKSRYIDIDLLLNYFRDEPHFETEMDETSVRFIYEHPTIFLGYQYTITPRSTVPDIYRLSPNYLDVNIHIDIPILMNRYVFQQFLIAMERFCKAFKLYPYHPLFEDVMPFKYELLLEVYHMVQSKYIQKHHEEMQSYVLLDEKVAYKMFKYEDDILALKDYYKDVSVFVPKYQLLYNGIQLIKAIEITDGIQTVIPPEIDTIFIRLKDQTLIGYDYQKIEKKVVPLLTKVPGTIEGTHVVLKKVTNKFYKIVKKAPIKNFDNTFKSIRSLQILESER
jgi:hypothetical protein